MSFESMGGLATAFSFGSVQQNKLWSSGAISLTYNHAITKRWLLGFDVVYEKISEEYLSGGFLFIIAPTSTVRTESVFITFAIENQFRYVLKEKFQMYSGFGFGYSTVTDKISGEDNSNKQTTGAPNFHLNLVGLRFGNQVAFKLEFGLGYKGLVNGGLGIRL